MKAYIFPIKSVYQKYLPNIKQSEHKNESIFFQPSSLATCPSIVRCDTNSGTHDSTDDSIDDLTDDLTDETTI